MVLILFWLCVGVVFYTYIGYPVIVILTGMVLNKEVKKMTYLPTVTILIPAYNEERFIRETLQNKLQLNYPKEKIEIIVVSDGSSDQTDKFVEEFSSQGVRLIRQNICQGKTAGLNRAVKVARGEIIVFSDANSLYHQDALRHLMANFSDTTVGYVTGQMIYVHPTGAPMGDGCSAYMRYENVIRRAETRAGSIVGVNGGVDAVRKTLYSPMRSDQLPDFVLPLCVLEKGFRIVFEPEAILKEHALEQSIDEYKMRVRVSLRALHAIKDKCYLLNPFKYGIFSWQLGSHKVLRYAAFLLFVPMYLSTLLLISEDWVYRLAFWGQTLFYCSALLGWYLERKAKGSGVLYVPFYFCLLNVASAFALWKFLNNEKQVTWIPRRG
ncbi:MAG TPA: glycosyltransferase family 2 protein [Nitrospinaceae bacterium]|nr:glycosyltransferase family 2 protein [Nitrospinaceae bacterium]